MSLGSGLAAQLGFADEVYTNEVQSITTTGTPTGGTFTLTFDGAVTAAIAYNASAATVQAALEALPNIGSGGVVCAGGALPSAVSVTFSGALVAGRNVPLIALGTNSLTGGSSPTVAVALTTAGTGYGDFVTPDRFLEFLSEGIELQIDRQESSALRAGNTVLRTDRWTANKKGAAGPIEVEVPTKGFGKILRWAFGTCAISTPSGGTLTRDHTAVLSDLANRSAVVQVGRPDVNGTVRPFSYLGAKCVGGEFKNSVDEYLVCTLDTDAQDETLAQALAAASYASSFKLMSFVGGQCTMEGANVDVLDITVRWVNALKTDRHFIRNDSRKKQPVHAGMREVTGDVTLEFTDLAAYNRFVNGTTAAITALWEGDTIESTLKYGLLLTMPNCRFDGTTPSVSGPDVVTITLPFKALWDGTTEPLTARYRTTDTAL